MGQGYRLRARFLLQEFECAGPVLHLLLRYTQALIAQMAQTAACNRHLTLDQQLYRWLLMSLDRLPSNELAISGGARTAHLRVLCRDQKGVRTPAPGNDGDLSR